MNVQKVRDLTLVDLGQQRTMVIACDSCGGVGMKERDVLQVSPHITGRYTARVAILEVLCTGAEVICLTSTICNEMNSTGKDMIEGIRAELQEAGINNVVLTGSTEENFPTVATGLGVTAVGMIQSNQLKVNSIKQQALLVALGQPKVGQEVLAGGGNDRVHYQLIKQMLKDDEVYEIIPVGSKGILYEMQELARNNRLNLIVNPDMKLDVMKSGGPSTAVIAAVSARYFNKMDFQVSMALVGEVCRGE